jgi:hypothetical protein
MTLFFCNFLLCFLYAFFYNKACNWSIGFLQIVNISKLYHMLGSNHSTLYMWSFQVLFPYKFLVLKMRTLLLMKYMWKTITFHCLPSSNWLEWGIWTGIMVFEKANEQWFHVWIWSKSWVIKVDMFVDMDCAYGMMICNMFELVCM